MTKTQAEGILNRNPNRLRSFEDKGKGNFLFWMKGTLVNGGGVFNCVEGSRAVFVERTIQEARD